MAPRSCVLGLQRVLPWREARPHELHESLQRRKQAAGLPPACVQRLGLGDAAAPARALRLRPAVVRHRAHSSPVSTLSQILWMQLQDPARCCEISTEGNYRRLCKCLLAFFIQAPNNNLELSRHCSGIPVSLLRAALRGLLRRRFARIRLSQFVNKKLLTEANDISHQPIE